MALPSVVPLTASPRELRRTDVHLPTLDSSTIAEAADGTLLLNCGGTVLRAQIVGSLGDGQISVVLPLDALFDVRIKAARRLWLALHEHQPGEDPAMLSRAQRDHLVSALRALDGRMAGATYREIAAVLFGDTRLPQRGWKTHDLRDRTIRLCRLGAHLMQGGYRQLLVLPHRQRLI